MSDMSAAIQAAEKSFAEELTADFREHAISMGWPAEVANEAAALIVDGHILIAWSKAFGQQIHEWEYGTPDRKPVQAIRTWINAADDKFADRYWEQIASTVWKDLI